MGNFMSVSDDKKTISLSVPLGSTVYQVMTDCENQCYLMEESLKEAPSDVKSCNYSSACHVKYCGLNKVVVTLNNLSFIDSLWGKTIFADSDEAGMAGIELVKANRKRFDDYITNGEQHGNSI